MDYIETFERYLNEKKDRTEEEILKEILKITDEGGMTLSLLRDIISKKLDEL